ncbi:MAG TPA: hypothetical protein DGT23_06170 [Micromonosporaceae bacterium]|nr:hypothetical protein [Micromonosporaceae bacterium]
MTKVRQALGEWGERVAAAHLVAAGMVLLDRNWRTAAGEIDIIARDGDAVVFCEQKLQDLRRAKPCSSKGLENDYERQRPGG